MAFWSSKQSLSSKQKFKFYVEFPDLFTNLRIGDRVSTTNPKYAVRSITRPSIQASIPEKDVTPSGTFIRVAGLDANKIDVSEITLKLTSTVDISSQKNYEAPTLDFAFVVMALKHIRNKQTNLLGQIKIYELSEPNIPSKVPGSEVVSIWSIKNPIITKIDFGSLDYNSEELTEITLSFVPPTPLSWDYEDSFGGSTEFNREPKQILTRNEEEADE